MANEPVLVDTSCWIEYFNRPGTEVAASVEALIHDDRAALAGIVLAELSQGVRSEEELSELLGALGALTWIETTRDTYARAGRLGFELRRMGVTVPVTDCVIAAACEYAGGHIRRAHLDLRHPVPTACRDRIAHDPYGTFEPMTACRD